MTSRQLFLQHVGQTSEAPMGLEMVRAAGLFQYDAAGNPYMDLIGGISVCNLGHGHPAVIHAIQDQAARYLHLMVYGEFIESPQVQYAKALASALPEPLESVFFTNSGTEAIEGAMKLAKRFTGRPDLVAFEHSYHGSTQGSLSLIGDEYWRQAFRPLLPGIHHLRYNAFDDLDQITARTAAVFVETVQAEAGVIRPDAHWIKALRQRCDAVGALLILDENQCGFGRLGTMWGFEQFGIQPDILVLGKALGGGMPLGAFVSSRSCMQVLARDPVLGHISTFGGHPVCCAAGLASFNALNAGNWIQGVSAKGELFRKLLVHPSIRQVRQIGLMLAVELEDAVWCKKVIDRCLSLKVITDWFLFAPNCLRLVPPLIIEEADIQEACSRVLQAIEEVASGT